MGRQRCAACGRVFRRRSQVREQRYCGSPACRRERRRRWQSSKRRSDADYRHNQALAQRAWAAAHADYWRNYRLSHSGYVERNRVQQRERDRRRAAALAKMASSEPILSVDSGIYRMVPASAPDLAKMAAWTVKITVLSRDYGSAAGAGGILQREDSIGSRGPPG
jgi:hypothetical protein